MRVMTRKFLRYTLLAFGLSLLWACNLTKSVPDGQLLLRGNAIKIDSAATLNTDAQSIIKQKPNSSVVGIKVYLYLYNWGTPGSSHWWSRMWHSMGEAPIIIDSNKVERTVNQLNQYYFNQGYFNNNVAYSIKQLKNPKKGEVTYYINRGPQYRVVQLNQLINSEGILDLVKYTAGESLLKEGMKYNATLMEQEQNRLVNLFRNNGYFGFQKNWIHYSADTTLGNHTMSLTMIIDDFPVGNGDSTVPHEPYYIENIYIDYDYKYNGETNTYTDTLTSTDGYLFTLKDSEEQYTPQTITSSIHFEPGTKFNAAEVKSTYTHLSSLNLFRGTEIIFEPTTDSNTRKLNAYVRMTPLDKRSLITDLELSTTSGSFGSTLEGSLLTRNSFGAGELMDFTLKFGIGQQVNPSEAKILNTVEYGAETSISFPRMWIPFKMNIPKRMVPKTKLLFSYGYIQRLEFTRSISKISLTYSWRESETKTHSITPIDFNYVNLLKIDPDYLNSLQFKTGFQSNLIQAIRYVFNYEAAITKNKTQSFRGVAEYSGWFSAFDKWMDVDEVTNQKVVNGVPYAEYFKFEADYRYYYKSSPKHTLVFRFFTGVTYNYGNTPYLPPFEKSYFGGGANDNRAWTAYRMGPGGINKIAYENGEPYLVYDKVIATAPLKFNLNLEYRFPVLGKIEGAVFSDAGNVFLFNRDYGTSLGTIYPNLEEGKFSGNVLKKMALGTGLGLRYNLDFFVFRLDMGVKVWDPGEADGSEFVLMNTSLKDITYNLAIGYPF